VRVLLDENIPHDLIPEFPGHIVLTVQGLGWAGVKNGDLLTRACGQIDALLTMDRKLERQHDLSVLPLIAEMREAVARVAPGSVEYVGAAR
jgi:hypothetical protein